jgi:hypothetical protein
MKIFLSLLTIILGISFAQTTRAMDFDREGLLAQVPEGQHAQVRAADRHILVVRHARKTSPDCNAMNCQLSPRGEAMVARLHTLLGPVPLDAAYASAACRTRNTARAGGIKVQSHRAADGLSKGCEEGERIDRLRGDAFADARDSDKRWTLVAEHSNTVCQWLAEFVPEAAAAQESAGCHDGRLASSAYGGIYWLYRAGGTWKLITLGNAFEIGATQKP